MTAGTRMALQRLMITKNILEEQTSEKMCRLIMRTMCDDGIIYIVKGLETTSVRLSREMDNTSKMKSKLY